MSPLQRQNSKMTAPSDECNEPTVSRWTRDNEICVIWTDSEFDSYFKILNRKRKSRFYTSLRIVCENYECVSRISGALNRSQWTRRDGKPLPVRDPVLSRTWRSGRPACLIENPPCGTHPKRAYIPRKLTLISGSLIAKRFKVLKFASLP